MAAKFSKKTCVHGHLKTEATTGKRGECKVCIRKWKQEHIEEGKLYHRKNYRKHRSRKVKESRKRATKERASNPEKRRSYQLNSQRKRTGWTPEAVEAAKVSQKNRCAICKKKFIATPNADHKHCVPPIPRGLLCRTCNAGIGQLKDSPELLRAAAHYVEVYQ